MRKLVNGKIIDIKNIDIFERAAEGIAMNRTLNNVIPEEKLEINFDEVETYISLYKKYYDSLPFPLYGVDDDLKYSCAGLYINKNVVKNINIWVDNGLYITIDESKGVVLGFINKSWGLIYCDNIQTYNIDITKYKEAVGFDEYIWALSTLFKGESTCNYYNMFMPNFVSACNNQAMILKWELSNILVFGNIPDKINLKQNRIIDINKNLEYNIDIYTGGSRQTTEKQRVWSFNDNEDSETIRNKSIRVYKYDLYSKPTPSDDSEIKPGEDKLKRTELFGINSLFCTLCYIKNSIESEEFSEFTGLVCDGNLIFCVDNRIFISKADSYSEAQEIARGVEFYSYDRSIIYFIKSKTIALGVKKEIVYSYSLMDGNLRLCKTQFVRI